MFVGVRFVPKAALCACVGCFRLLGLCMWPVCGAPSLVAGGRRTLLIFPCRGRKAPPRYGNIRAGLRPEVAPQTPDTLHPALLTLIHHDRELRFILILMASPIEHHPSNPGKRTCCLSQVLQLDMGVPACLPCMTLPTCGSGCCGVAPPPCQTGRGRAQKNTASGPSSAPCAVAHATCRYGTWLSTATTSSVELAPAAFCVQHAMQRKLRQPERGGGEVRS